MLYRFESCGNPSVSDFFFYFITGIHKKQQKAAGAHLKPSPLEKVARRAGRGPGNSFNFWKSQAKYNCLNRISLLRFAPQPASPEGKSCRVPAASASRSGSATRPYAAGIWPPAYSLRIFPSPRTAHTSQARGSDPAAPGSPYPAAGVLRLRGRSCREF